MARIVIADDHDLVREGLRNVLSREPDMEVVGEAGNGPELLAVAASSAPDVIVMDAHMPKHDAADSLQRLHRMRPGLPVLVLSVLPEEHAAMHFLRLGAAGYVAKTASASDLVAALRKLLDGARYISPSLAQRIALAGPSDNQPHELLSERELQVLRLIASGRPIKTIAASLSISVSTVHTYRTRILEKMHLQSDVDIARYAVHHYLVE
jgi:DNA-binding NarL/FixJ family response regulator